MPTETLNLVFVLTTCAVTLGTWIAARRDPHELRGRTFWLLGMAGFVAYTGARDLAVVALLRQSGLGPSTFLFVDLICLIPYLLAAPRAAKTAAEGQFVRMAGWAAAFLFGALAPAAYVALAFKKASGSITVVATIYLMVVALGGTWGLLRKSGLLASARRRVFGTVTVRA